MQENFKLFKNQLNRISAYGVTSEALGTCERLAQGRCLAVQQQWVKPLYCWSLVQHHNRYTTESHTTKFRNRICGTNRTIPHLSKSPTISIPHNIGYLHDCDNNGKTPPSTTTTTRHTTYWHQGNIDNPGMESVHHRQLFHNSSNTLNHHNNTINHNDKIRHESNRHQGSCQDQAE